MPVPLVQQVGPDDADTLALVGAATFLETFADTLPGADIVAHCNTQHSAKAYRQYMADGSAAWVATMPETFGPVGYSLVTAPDLPVPLAAGDLELKRIYLLSRFHGDGTGWALLKASIDYARLAGAPRLLLGVYQHNEQAIGFYRRAGFEQIGTRRFQVGQNQYDDGVFALTF